MKILLAILLNVSFLTRHPITGQANMSVLVQNKRHYTLFMDEPEVSLHVEWQQQLVSLIRDLNPNAQIILTTHSPAVIMNGWADCVTDVEDIVS